MFQAFPVRSTSCRRRRRRSAMSTICINRAAAAGPLGHDEPRFCACCAVQRSRVSLGDGSSVCERRGSLSARGYLPVFSLALLVISVAGGRRSACTVSRDRIPGSAPRGVLRRDRRASPPGASGRKRAGAPRSGDRSSRQRACPCPRSGETPSERPRRLVRRPAGRSVAGCRPRRDPAAPEQSSRGFARIAGHVHPSGCLLRSP